MMYEVLFKDSGEKTILEDVYFYHTGEMAVFCNTKGDAVYYPIANIHRIKQYAT